MAPTRSRPRLLPDKEIRLPDNRVIQTQDIMNKVRDRKVINLRTGHNMPKPIQTQ